MADQLFEIRIICPERIFYDGDCDMLELRTTEGEIGIYAGHIPLTAVVAPGILRIKNHGETREAALHDGFIEILPQKVTILAESCEWPEEIDINRAKEAQIRAERRIKNEDNIDIQRAETALRRALIRISLADKQ